MTYKIGALRNELKDSVTQVEDYRLSEKKYEKKIKEKDKDIYDIKKDLVKATEDHVADSKEISELKCKVNQEKKEKNKLQKKEVKNLINNNSFKKNEVNSQTESFQCNICVLNFTAQEHLNAHIGTCHKRTTPACTQTTSLPLVANCQQTDEHESFTTYKCFYCDIQIDSEVFLSKHIGTCVGWPIVIILLQEKV